MIARLAAGDAFSQRVNLLGPFNLATCNRDSREPFRNRGCETGYSAFQGRTNARAGSWSIRTASRTITSIVLAIKRSLDRCLGANNQGQKPLGGPLAGLPLTAFAQERRQSLGQDVFMLMLYERYGHASARLFRFDACRLKHLAPFLAFNADQFAEFGGCH
jgi:hypothetical protein